MDDRRRPGRRAPRTGARSSPSRGAVSSPATASHARRVAVGARVRTGSRARGRSRSRASASLAARTIVTTPRSAALEVAGEQLHPDEAGRAGEQHGSVVALIRAPAAIGYAQATRDARLAGVDQLVDVTRRRRRPAGAAGCARSSAASRSRAATGSSAAASSRRWMIPTAGRAPMTPISALRPREHVVGAEVLRVHRDERAAERLAQDHGHARDRGLGERVHERRAEADHARGLLTRPGHVARRVDQHQQRDPERVALRHEPRALLGAGRVEHAAEVASAGWRSRRRSGRRSGRGR